MSNLPSWWWAAACIIGTVQVCVLVYAVRQFAPPVRFIRGFRAWHWLPRAYEGVNGCTTTLWVWGWWAWEV